MAETVLWIGGWASDLEIWGPEFQRLYPGYAHTFLDAHAILSQPGLLPQRAAALGSDDTLAAWSLGSLILHRALIAGFAASCRMVSICPVFSFCRDDGPWPKPAVDRMARRLSRDRTAVLAQFRDLALGAHADSARKDAWTRRAATYATDELQRGLEYLAGYTADPAALPREARIRFLASAGDPLAPAITALKGEAGWLDYPEGHVPFLDHPASMALALGSGKAAGLQ